MAGHSPGYDARGRHSVVVGVRQPAVNGRLRVCASRVRVRGHAVRSIRAGSRSGPALLRVGMPIGA
jgi:hypothetical protein